MRTKRIFIIAALALSMIAATAYALRNIPVHMVPLAIGTFSADGTIADGYNVNSVGHPSAGVYNLALHDTNLQIANANIRAWAQIDSLTPLFVHARYIPDQGGIGIRIFSATTGIPADPPANTPITVVLIGWRYLRAP